MTRVTELSNAEIAQILKDTERKLDVEAMQLAKQVNALARQIQERQVRLDAIDQQRGDIAESRRHLAREGNWDA